MHTITTPTFRELKYDTKPFGINECPKRSIFIDHIATKTRIKVIFYLLQMSFGFGELIARQNNSTEWLWADLCRGMIGAPRDWRFAGFARLTEGLHSRASGNAAASFQSTR